LREHFGIEKWQVFGGSWGQHAGARLRREARSRVTELVLRGIFPRPDEVEIKWFYQEGTSWNYLQKFFPDVREIQLVPS